MLPQGRDPGTITRRASTLPKPWFTGSDSKDGMRSFLSGSLSGFTCKFVEYPFDTVKVLQQTDSQKLFKGPIDAALKTIRSHGILSLYQGMSSPLLGAMAENAVVFSAYGANKKLLGVTDENWSPRWKYAMAGMGAGFFSASVLTPVELVKCKIQVQQAITRGGGNELSGSYIYKGPVDVVVQTIKKEGFAGLYRGHTACLMRELPGNFAWFGMYEATLRFVQEKGNYKSRAEVPLALKAISGSVGGVFYWAVPFPFDTVKSVMQTDAKFNGWSFPRVTKVIYQEEGIRGLYKGLTVTCVRAAPAHAMIFYTFELCESILARY
jgi:hypothetical protein